MLGMMSFAWAARLWILNREARMQHSHEKYWSKMQFRLFLRRSAATGCPDIYGKILANAVKYFY